MSQTIILKKSAVAGKIPEAADLEIGEVAINMADRILYFKDSSEEVKSIKGKAAEELTQAQVESSASTGFGLVSGQRIWQAISKWWEGIGTVFGKTLLGSANAAAARTTLGLGTAATRNVGTDSGNVMEVGAGGWLGRAGSDSYILGYPQNQSQSISQIYQTDEEDEGVQGYVASIHFASYDSWGRVRVSHSDPRAWVQGGVASVGSGWTAELLTTGTILSTTGQSTDYPMTQKAVTDAINARGFEDASGVLTAQSGDLSNAISNFLQATTQADAKSRLGVPNITVSTRNPSGGANGDIWFKV